MSSRISTLVLSVVAAACVLSAVAPAVAADARAERIEGYKANKRAIAAVKEALRDGDVAAVVEPARSMAAFAGKIPALYPPGSKGGFFSAAKDDIWNDFPGFTRKAQAFQNSARELADLAASGTADQPRLSDALGRVQNTCKACHDSYKRGR